MWQELLNRIRIVVSRGKVTLVDDSRAAQLMQVRVTPNWMQDAIPRLAEYGFQSVPPAGADAVLLFLAGSPSEGVVIATGHQQYRVTGLKSGETCVSDDKGQKVYLSEAGIRIEGGALPIEINAPGGLTINAPGGLAINADTVFNGTVEANGHPIDETHRHTGVTVGLGQTGAVS